MLKKMACGVVVASMVAPIPASSLNSRSVMGFVSSRRRMPDRDSVIAMAMYKVLLRMPLGEKTLSCPDDKSILDAAEEANVELPFSCRVGSCSSCAGKLEVGTVDQGANAFLDYDHIEDGFVLTCIAYPTSDVIVRTHAEDELVATLT